MCSSEITGGKILAAEIPDDVLKYIVEKVCKVYIATVH